MELFIYSVKLFIPVRDILPGSVQSLAKSESMDDSRNVLAVISSNLRADAMSIYELKLARRTLKGRQGQIFGITFRNEYNCDPIKSVIKEFKIQRDIVWIWEENTSHTCLLSNLASSLV